MKKFYAFASLIFLLSFTSKAQQQPNGTLDDIKEFCTRYTVPFVMPDGVKLYTDVYLPRLRDSLRVSLGDIDLFGTTIHTDTVTFIPYGAQLIAYDSVGLGANKVANPDPYQLPTIFTRTPYDKGDFDQVGAILAILGYNYMLQDMRGRYSSEGVYFPMYSDSWNKNPYHPLTGHVLDYLPLTDPKHSNKHEDGYNSIRVIDTITQSGFYDGLPHTNERLNNGFVGMFGASALGNTQLQLGLAHRITDSIPVLKCLMPIVATTEHYLSTGYNNGVFRDRIVTGWLKGQIFSGTDDDLIPGDNDRQNNIHSSADYDLPKTITLNGVTKTFQQNKFEAANLSIDHFTAMRYLDGNGVLGKAGFYPNSTGRPDMDGSVAPVNEFGEAVDPVTQLPLPNLTHSRYENMDVPVFHVTGWWDIFTEGQIHTMNYTMDALHNINKTKQKIIIGPWAHQTTASRASGDRIYPKNTIDITKIDLSDFNINSIPINDVLHSDLITWFRYNLNYDSSHFLGEPKFIIKESGHWQRLGDGGALGVIYIKVPSQDYVVPYVDMINFLAGQGGLSGLKIKLKTDLIPEFEITQDVPNVGQVLPAFGGDPLQQIPYKDFAAEDNVRFYVAGPDSLADAISGYPGNEKIGNYWQGCDRFPPSEHIQWRKMFMHQDGSFNDNAPTQDEGYRMYVSDPDDPILTVGGSNMIVRSPDGSRNSQSQMEMTDPTNAPYTMDREGVIQFNSDVIQDSITVIGLPVCTLYAKSNPGGVVSGPTDCDWNFRICDVWPDGRVYFVQEGIVNARARDFARSLVDQMGTPGTDTYVDGREDPGDTQLPYSNINIGELYEYVFKMMPIGYSFAKGHRIRVLVNSSNYTRYQANPQVPLEEGDFFRRKPGDGQFYVFNGVQMFPRVAVQRVHFSPQHPTSINFPISNSSFTYNSLQNLAADTKLDISVFPNPTIDNIQIFANMQGAHNVVITDITGRIITSGNFDDNIVFDVAGFGKGIYFATVTDMKDKTQKATKRFVVQ